MTNSFSSERWGEDMPITLFTYIHFIAGVIARLLNVKITIWLFIMIAFEYVENTRFGIQFFEVIGNKQKYRQLAKQSGLNFPTYEGDSLGNAICDILAGWAGWLVTDWLIDMKEDYQREKQNMSNEM